MTNITFIEESYSAPKQRFGIFRLPHFALLFVLLIGGLQLRAEVLFTGYPFVAYSGETRLMVGAFAFVKHIPPPRSEDADSNEYSLLSNMIFSQNKQFLVVFVPEYKAPEYGLRISSDIYLKLWPDNYFGVGNFTNSEDAEAFTSNLYAAESTISKQVYKQFYLSLRSSQGFHELTKVVADGYLENADLPGKENSIYSGLGYNLRFDTTNSVNYPTRGVLYKFQQIFYHPSLGSDFQYTEHKLDLQNYLSLGDKIVLASQSDFVCNSGKAEEIPFFNYLELGNRLRAYESKRFTDKVRIAQRIEQRVFPWQDGFRKRLGFVVFGEVGQVASEVKDIRLSDWHWSAGFGLRFSILPQEKLNLRMDFGFGDDSFNFIVNAREAF